MPPRPIELAGADLRYDAHAWPRAEADAFLAALRTEIRWEQHRLKLFGREIGAPRLSCWIGDAGAVYTYSGARFEPRPWTPTTATLRDELAARLGLRCNSVLANLYRDGRDSMGWHSDDEPELGREPVIASLSFGAERTFRLRSRTLPRVELALELAHGSLLVMAGATQRLFQHALPRRVRISTERINLTFRQIEPLHSRNEGG
ncbi:MAG: alpha-ketoglutarate-dependent dioxygenase AlkB [Rhodanobacter sp.]|jgi:alkylated DNA repair dioxygenase AlkB|nr:alpha-ketoglutarate-dependent dioxygenase AlkB [Rhodanobacter sp.]